MTSNNPIIYLGASWNELTKDFLVGLRVYVVADFVLHWHVSEDRIFSFSLRKMGFSANV